MMKFKFILMFAMIFLAMPLVMGAEFDNRLTYSDDDTKVTVKNWFGFGGDIAEMELITPRVNRVGVGKDLHPMIWKVNTFDEDYINAFGVTEIIDIARGNDDLEFHFEIAVYEDVEVQDYSESCISGGMNINGSRNKDICTKEKSGTHLENKLVRWDDFNSKAFPKGEITLALTTDVGIGDHYDAIPTLFGERVERWAEWTESLNENLIVYYKLDETTGTNALESVFRIHNGTAQDWVDSDWVGGIIGNGAEFSKGDADRRINISEIIMDGLQNFSISMWVNLSIDGSNENMFGSFNQEYGTGDWFAFSKAGAEDYWNFGFNIDGTTRQIHNEEIPVAIDIWYHLVAVYNGTGVDFFINGSKVNDSGGYSATNNEAFISTRAALLLWFHKKVLEIIVAAEYEMKAAATGEPEPLSPTFIRIGLIPHARPAPTPKRTAFRGMLENRP